MAPFGMPSGLYSMGPLSVATLAAASRQEQQLAAFSPTETTLKQKFLQVAGPVTAFSPAEKKIAMYSRVR